MSFSQDVKRWANQTALKKVEVFVREFSQDIAYEVVQNTPVNTGFLRGSWYTKLNDPGHGPEGRTDPSGSQSVSNMTLTVNGAQVGDRIFFLNNANYAHFVEFGTQYMAPRAYVRGTLARASQIAQTTISRIDR